VMRRVQMVPGRGVARSTSACWGEAAQAAADDALDQRSIRAR
jgi:hypothetical protein